MNDSKQKRVTILGATGPTGIHLVEALQTKTYKIRVVSRKRDKLQRVFTSESIEHSEADLTDSEATIKAVAGSDFVYDCVGLPPDSMDQHVVISKNIARALNHFGAFGIQISSFWAYLPVQRLPLDEDHPRQGGPEWVRYRREAEDLLQDAGATILHLPDFYGPDVHTSILQNAIREAHNGETVNWMGSSQTPREHIFIQDAMDIAAGILEVHAAKGRRLMLPGAGPLNGDQLVNILKQQLEREVKLRTAGPLLLRIVSLFKSELRDFMQMVPHYVKSISYDASRLRKLIGDLPMTSYEDGIRQTLAWMVKKQQ